MKKRRIDQNTTLDIPRESLLLKNPLSYIVYSTRNHETITMQLFSQESHAIFLSSHIDPDKIRPILSQFSACLAHTNPDERNPYSLGILSFLNCVEYHGHPIVF